MGKSTHIPIAAGFSGDRRAGDAHEARHGHRLKTMLPTRVSRLPSTRLAAWR